MKDSKVDTVVVTMNDVKEGVIKEGAADPQSQAAQLLAMKESMRGNITTHTKKPTSALEQTTTNTNSKHKSISESIASMIGIISKIIVIYIIHTISNITYIY